MKMKLKEENSKENIKWLDKQSEDGEIDVNGLILLNQSWATVPLACDQDDGRRRGACIEKDGFSMEDGWESGWIQCGRRQGHVISTWFK